MKDVNICSFLVIKLTTFSGALFTYCQISTIRHPLVGNKIVDHSRCSSSIACWCCSNDIFILNLTPGFNGLGKDNYKRRRETLKFLPEASFGLRVLSLPASVCLCVCPSTPELVRTITHHAFKLEPPNLNKRCKTTGLRSLLFWEAIDLDLQGQI